MSVERSRDLLQPPARRTEELLETAQQILDPEFLEDERQLSRAIRRLRGDDVALAAFLAQLPTSRRLAAQLALVREIGGSRGIEMGARAFGATDALVPRPARPLETAPPDSRARYDLARAHGLKMILQRVLL